MSTIAPSRKMALVGRKHPALHERALAIDDPTEREWSVLANRMYLTLRDTGGYAIAAPQVGVPVRLIVTGDQRALANVRVDCIGADLDLTVGPETCLSLPGRTFQVPRSTYARVIGHTLKGELRAVTVDDFDARLWQHEFDHLEGILISDHWPEVRGR